MEKGTQERNGLGYVIRENSAVPKLSFVSDNSLEDSIKSFKALKVGTSWDKDGQLVNLLLDEYVNNYEILQNIF